MVKNGYAPGGSVLYAGITALRCGWNVRLFTSFSGNFSGKICLEGMEVHSLPAEYTTTFHNAYDHGLRSQKLISKGHILDLKEIPENFLDSDILLLAPVVHEIPLSFEGIKSFPLTGACLQGWIRSADEQGKVSQSIPDEIFTLSGRIEIMFASDEDLNHNKGMAEKFRNAFKVFCYTKGENGSTVYQQKKAIEIQGLKVPVLDPTGAGDVYACSFMIRYAETNDFDEAARFANIFSAVSVTGHGVNGIPSRKEVECM
jgi:sugar/nucleoside kinase (ribokinase family)